MTIRERFDCLKREGRDISEHLDTLYNYAQKCNSIVELGANEGVSSTAFCLARPKSFISFDIASTPMLEKLIELAAHERIHFTFTIGDSRIIEIPECDLLFIDTLHIYDQLKVELTKHGNKAKQYIILHDTETFGTEGEYPGSGGLQAAVKEYIADNTEWKLKEHYRNNNGLTILARKKSWLNFLISR